MDVSPLNLGMIASYYYIGYTTVELFASSLSASTKLGGLLEILSAAPEFASVPVRHREDELLRALAMHCPLRLDSARYNDPHVKTNILLQCHFSRRELPRDLAHDLRPVLEKGVRLLQAMVDVIASSGWLSPAIACMELSQMVTQALWDRDPALLQLPHFTRDLAKRCAARDVEGVFDLMVRRRAAPMRGPEAAREAARAHGARGTRAQRARAHAAHARGPPLARRRAPLSSTQDLDDDDRRSLLQMSPAQLADVARVCNRYPSVDVSYAVEDEDEVASGDTVVVNVALAREAEGSFEVHAPRFPKRKDEGWWLVIGEQRTNTLISIKRVMLQQKAKVKLDFVAPDAGEYKYMLYFMCDSYLGCDQEYEFELKVAEAEDEDEGEDEEDEEEDAGEA